MDEDNSFIIAGPPPMQAIPDISLGKFFHDQLSLFSQNASEALVDALTGNYLTYKDILLKSSALAESLMVEGFGTNTMVTISSENSIEFFIPVLATLYIGGTVAPINHNYTEREMIHALNITNSQIVFCSKQVHTKFKNIKTTMNSIKKLLIIDDVDKADDVESMNSFVNRVLWQGSSLSRFRPVDVPVDQTAFILFSSGTTGLPKGVMITHKNVLAKCMHYIDPRLYNQEENRRILCVLPFYHVYGLFTTLINISTQTKVVVIKKFEEKLFLSSIEKYKITCLTIVPPLAIFFAKSPLVDNYDLSSLTEVSSGAAPLSRNTEEVVKKRLKIGTIRQGYGLTETTLGATGPPFGFEKMGSCGKVLPYLWCKIRDPETGKSVGPHQVGEICFKGAVVMKGYYQNEEDTKKSFTKDGWLLTGDLGYYDSEEYLFIVDRLKELIKYKGFQVPPAELEALLLTNSKIRDVAVIGVSDEEAGELPKAFVVLAPDASMTEQEVKQFVAEKVSSQKRLRGGVEFVREIPKSPSGKILRRQLKQLVRKDQKSKL